MSDSKTIKLAIVVPADCLPDDHIGISYYFSGLLKALGIMEATQDYRQGYVHYVQTHGGVVRVFMRHIDKDVPIV